MGSHLEALLAPQDAVLEEEAQDIGLKTFRIPQAMLLIPLTESWAADWQEAALRFTHLSSRVAAWAAEASTRVPIAYVENETFAGEGLQGAVIWNQRQVAWGPRFTCDVECDADDPYVWTPDSSQSAINSALREFGVSKGQEHDEFAALGLHLKRKTEDWLG